MMKLDTLSIGLATTFLLLGTVPAVAAIAADVAQPREETPSLLRLAERREPDRETERTPPRAIDATTGYPIVNIDTWVFEEDLPWSQLVLIRSAALGDYVAVPDRAYEAGAGADILNLGIASLWSPHQIEVYGYGINQVCGLMGLVCRTEHPVFPVSAASLKVGDRVFHLQGKNSIFRLPPEAAWVLRNALPEEVWLRVAILRGSDYTTRPVGPDTIRAFQTVYQDAEPVEVGALPEAPLGPVSRLPENLPEGLPEIDESAWRRRSGVAWSQPIIVRDDFDGDYLAVLDDAYFDDGWGSTDGIITNWSADQLAIHIYNRTPTSYACGAVSGLRLQIGDQTFYLEGANNRFPISPELAKVLGSHPQEPPLLSYATGNNEVVTREIGPGTVAAWSLIYGTYATKPTPTDL